MLTLLFLDLSILDVIFRLPQMLTEDLAFLLCALPGSSLPGEGLVNGGASFLLVTLRFCISTFFLWSHLGSPEKDWSMCCLV